MGCANTVLRMGRHVVTLESGVVVSDMRLMVRSPANGSLQAPSGLMIDNRCNTVLVQGLRHGSPVQRHLDMLQRRDADGDFDIQPGEHVVSVNGDSSVDGILRHLHWSNTLSIHLRRYTQFPIEAHHAVTTSSTMPENIVNETASCGAASTMKVSKSALARTAKGSTSTTSAKNVRFGLEDCMYISATQFASNVSTTASVDTEGSNGALTRGSSFLSDHSDGDFDMSSMTTPMTTKKSL
mmetsp:Transcript_12205/g.28457  ORF Transcript_12205/g.28457 Transcript_12205/m.28457 type:complete len:239 (+) Transcript_12205:85-801(+)